MKIFKRIVFAASLAVLASAARGAVPQSGGDLVDHGHSGPGDGGVLTNPVITGGNIKPQSVTSKDVYVGTASYSGASSIVGGKLSDQSLSATVNTNAKALITFSTTTDTLGEWLNSSTFTAAGAETAAFSATVKIANSNYFTGNTFGNREATTYNVYLLINGSSVLKSAGSIAYPQTYALVTVSTTMANVHASSTVAVQVQMNDIYWPPGSPSSVNLTGAGIAGSASNVLTVAGSGTPATYSGGVHFPDGSTLISASTFTLSALSSPTISGLTSFSGPIISSVSVLSNPTARETQLYYYGDPGSGDPAQTNVLMLQNMNPNQPSAMRWKSYDSHEMGAIGWANSNPVPYGGVNFIGNSDLTNAGAFTTNPAPKFRLINSGWYSGAGHSFTVWQSSGNGDFATFQQSLDDENPPVALFSRGSDGNIGVKTANPSASLEVNGTFNADGAATFYSTMNLNTSTASRVLVTDGSQNVISSGVTATTLGYLDATSSIQTQINSLAPLSSPSLTGNIGIGSYGLISSDSGGVDLRANNGATAASTIYLDTNSAHRVVISSMGYVQAGGVYSQTTASAANVVVDSSGNIMRNSSSLRYKAGVADYTKGLSSVLSMRPISFYGKTDPTKRRHAGFLAEDLDKSDLKEFVVYDDRGKPDAIEYPYLSAILVNAIKDLQKEIEDLRAQLKSRK